MDYLQEPKGKLVDNPDLHWVFFQWTLDTYGKQWFWLNSDWWMNFALFGQNLTKILAIVYDENKAYSKVADGLGIYQVWQYRGGQESKLLMPINVADPTFFDRLKVLIDEFTPLTTQNALSSNLPSLKAILQRSSDRPIRDFS